MLHQEIGQAQAWGYPVDKVAALWECLLYDWCREQDPIDDLTLTNIWSGVERLLIEQLLELERLVTSS